MESNLYQSLMRFVAVVMASLDAMIREMPQLPETKLAIVLCELDVYDLETMHEPRRAGTLQGQDSPGFCWGLFLSA